MRIGFCGAHRTGKTTLAKAVAAEMKIPSVITTTTGVFAENGMDPSSDLSLKDRVFIQNKILDSGIAQWSDEDKFTTDRTPVDYMAYLFASIQQEELTPELEVEIKSYKARAIEAVSEHFDFIFEVRPGIQVINAPGKASTMPSHIDHIAYMISGIISLNKFPCCSMGYIPEFVQDLQNRVNYVTSYRGVAKAFEGSK